MLQTRLLWVIDILQGSIEHFLRGALLEGNTFFHGVPPMGVMQRTETAFLPPCGVSNRSAGGIVPGSTSPERAGHRAGAAGRVPATLGTVRMIRA